MAEAADDPGMMGREKKRNGRLVKEAPWQENGGPPHGRR